jgi:hypothetical protein
MTREREIVKEFTTKAGESNNTWIANQVRLKAQLYDTRPAYIQLVGSYLN